MPGSPTAYNPLARIIVVGTTGAGKSTLAAALSSRLGVPHVEFDAYRHGPNWVETPNDVFRAQISEALSAEGWVADGNYSLARGIVWPRATAIVWLDYPFPVVFWRLWRRTWSRGIRRTELWNGNREDLWRHFLTGDSLFLWQIKTHWRRRRQLTEALAQPEYAHLRVLRFRSPRQAAQWLDSIPSRPMESPSMG